MTDESEAVTEQERVGAAFSMFWAGSDEGDILETWDTAELSYTEDDIAITKYYADLLDENASIFDDVLYHLVGYLDANLQEGEAPSTFEDFILATHEITKEA